MVNGLTRRNPLSFWTSHCPSRECRPPIPVATETMSRSGSTPLSTGLPSSSRGSDSPASAHASRAATSANWLERSSRRARGRGMWLPGSSTTSAAKVTGRPSAHSWSRVWTPLRPSTSPCHVLGASAPSGVVAPNPVMTTSVMYSPRQMGCWIRTGDLRCTSRRHRRCGGSWTPRRGSRRRTSPRRSR